MKSGPQSEIGKMTNSKKLIQIPGRGNKMIDVEKMKLLSIDSELAIHY